MKNRLPYKTFNLFESYNADIPFTERLYRWITTIGRYIVIGTEMIVLAAFVARFILDQNLNDLTDKVNDNNKNIVMYKSEEKRYRNIISKIDQAKVVEGLTKDTLMLEINKVHSLATQGILVSDVEYSNTIVDNVGTETLLITVSSPADLAPGYEDALNQNILNPNKILPNPNITLKLLNVASSGSKSSNSLNFTFKITRIT